MKFRIKRLAALMMAVMMMLGAASAFAQELQPDVRTGLLMSGKNIKTEMSIEVDQVTLSSLLTMFGMSGEADSGEQVVIDTVLSALNKMKVTALQSMSGAYVTVGTDKGSLMDVQINADMASGEANFSTSLMPDVKFSMPKDLLGTESYDSYIQSHSIQNISDWFVPYMTALNAFGEKQPADKVIIETGSFDMANRGSFDAKATLHIDSLLVAGLLDEFLPLIKEDKVIQEHLALISSAEIAAQSESMGDPMEQFKEAIAEFEKNIADMKTQPNKTIAKLDVYSKMGSEDMYLEAELIEDEVPMALITLSVLPGEEKNDMYLSLLTAQSESPEVETAGEEQPVDWAALRAGVLDGTNFESVLLEMTAIEVKNQAENKQIVTSRINMFATGMNIGIAVDSSSSLTGAYQSETSMAMSFLSPMPLITIHVKESQSDEVLPQASQEGFEEIILKEEMTEEDSQLLGEKLMTSIPDLMDRLKIAMPEEAGILTIILGGALDQAQPEEPATDLPQPVEPQPLVPQP